MDGRSLAAAGQFGGGHISGIPTPQRTLAARLDDAARMIANQCNRIEDTLAKINGTPRGNILGAGNALGKIEPERTGSPLAQSVQQSEELAKRLSELASNLEQVA